MADSTAFEWLCETLEAETSLDRLEARGTVRLALKQAGLAAASVTGEQLAVVVDRVLPPELEARGIADAGSVCGRLAGRVGEIADSSDGADSPEAVFARLGGGSS
jgi:hypothetical protein